EARALRSEDASGERYRGVVVFSARGSRASSAHSIRQDREDSQDRQDKSDAQENARAKHRRAKASLTRATGALDRGFIMELVLRVPKESEEEEFLRAHRATSPTAPQFLHHHEEGMSLRRYLEVLAEREKGDNLPAGHVPSTFLFAFAGARIVGRVTIRHALTPVLERVGGHIGYVVVPQFRRKGCATEMLRQSLRIARERF